MAIAKQPVVMTLELTQTQKDILIDIVAIQKQYYGGGEAIAIDDLHRELTKPVIRAVG